MASVYKRKEGGLRAVIRMKGYPTVCETLLRKAGCKLFKEPVSSITISMTFGTNLLL